MGNQTKKTYPGIKEQLWDAYQGGLLHAATIHLLQNPPAVILSTRELLTGVDAGPGGVPPVELGLKEKWAIAKTGKVVANVAYRQARKDGRALAMAVVAVLKNVLGREWNTGWNPVGFMNGSLRIDENPSSQLEDMGDYLASNPSHEVLDVNGVDCTAAACHAAGLAIDMAQAAFNAAKGAADVAKLNFDIGMNAARNRLIGVRNELSQLLADDDSRWLDYGFEKPAFIESPDVPEGFTAVSTDPGEVRGECDETDRADSYRFVIRNPALPVEENVLVDQIVWEPLFIAPGLVSGMTVTVEVSARNITGESQFTPPITVVVA